MKKLGAMAAALSLSVSAEAQETTIDVPKTQPEVEALSKQVGTKTEAALAGMKTEIAKKDEKVEGKEIVDPKFIAYKEGMRAAFIKSIKGSKLTEKDVEEYMVAKAKDIKAEWDEITGDIGDYIDPKDPEIDTYEKVYAMMVDYAACDLDCLETFFESKRIMINLAQSEEELAQSKKELAQSKKELAQSKKELAQSKKELAQSEEERAQSKKELAQSKKELEEVKEKGKVQQKALLGMFSTTSK